MTRQDKPTPVRGGVYTYSGIRRSEFMVISVDSLNAHGTVIVVEISDHAPEDVRGLLAVQFRDADPLPGRWVLSWRINYANADRFETADGGHGIASPETVAAVINAVRSSIEPL